MEIIDLKKFGMTNVEARIYLEILKIGETPIGTLIKISELHRGTVYNALNSLIKKGFVSFIDKNGLRYYKSSGKNIFESLSKQKNRDLEDSKAKIEKFFEKITKVKDSNEKQEIEVFSGVESFKSLFLDMYKECKKKNIEYLFQGRGGEMEDAVGSNFYNYTKKLRRDMQLKYRIILDTKYTKPSEKVSMSLNKRYVTNKIDSPVNFWIYGDTVLLVLFEISPLITIKIRSKNLANSLRNYFEHLWNLTTDFHDRKVYTTRVVHLTNAAKKMDILCHSLTTPFFLYPHNENKFLKYRKSKEKRGKTLTGKYDIDIFRAYKKLWKRKVKVRYITGKESIQHFFDTIKKDFGKNEVKKRLRDIKKNLKKYNVEIRIIEEFNPLTMYISQKNFIIVMLSSEEVYGFSTSEKEIIKTFQSLYEEYWNRAKPFEQYINKYN